MTDVLAAIYPWVKALHVVAVISWMAGIFYLPRLFVHHTEQAPVGSEADSLFPDDGNQVVPHHHAAGDDGGLGLRPSAGGDAGVLDWSAVWSYAKLGGVVGMTVFHAWCGRRLALFRDGRNDKPGRYYRMMNEVPTLLLLIIVVAVIVRPF